MLCWNPDSSRDNVIGTTLTKSLNVSSVLCLSAESMRVFYICNTEKLTGCPWTCNGEWKREGILVMTGTRPAHWNFPPPGGIASPPPPTSPTKNNLPAAIVNYVGFMFEKPMCAWEQMQTCNTTRFMIPLILYDSKYYFVSAHKDARFACHTVSPWLHMRTAKRHMSPM